MCLCIALDNVLLGNGHAEGLTLAQKLLCGSGDRHIRFNERCEEGVAPGFVGRTLIQSPMSLSGSRRCVRVAKDW